ncbi:MAG TPA: hypothetical protein VFO96_07960 [Gemmatimonadales bacterium]|jgi:hypothetical protein|nr:hypothetical protein [Gemmatimonadales bacterium]
MAQMPDWLPEFVHEMTERERLMRGDTAWLQEKAGMTLFGTIGREAILRLDGSVWWYEAVDWEHSDEYVWRLATAQEAAGALKDGAARHPRLLALIPSNPSGTACPSCKGSGELTRDGGTFPGVWCPTCSGVGFLVNETT